MFMIEYLTKGNLEIIQHAIQSFITKHEQDIKLNKLKQVYQAPKTTKFANDDTLVGFTQTSTQITQILVEEKKEIPVTVSKSRSSN